MAISLRPVDKNEVPLFGVKRSCVVVQRENETFITRVFSLVVTFDGKKVST